MRIELSKSDITLIVDEFGNPMFRCVSFHPRDAERLINYIEGLQNQIDDLSHRLDNVGEI